MKHTSHSVATVSEFLSLFLGLRAANSSAMQLINCNFKQHREGGILERSETSFCRVTWNAYFLHIWWHATAGREAGEEGNGTQSGGREAARNRNKLQTSKNFALTKFYECELQQKRSKVFSCWQTWRGWAEWVLWKEESVVGGGVQ